MTESRTRGQFHFSLCAARVSRPRSLSNLGKACAVLVLYAATAIASPASAQTYHNHGFLWTATGGMQDLGVPPGWTDSFAFAISQSGRIVGLLGNVRTGNQTAAAWTTSKGWQPLKKGLSASYSIAYAVNDSQEIVGATYTAAPPAQQTHAFLWTDSSGMQDLETLGGDFSVAFGINQLGEVVGLSTTATGVDHAFLWTKGGGMQDLGALLGAGSYSNAYAISDDGVIVGSSFDKNGAYIPVAWVAGQIQALNGLTSGGVPYGINRFAQIVGTTGPNAFLWTRAGGVQDLGLLSGGTSAAASGINQSGDVVGWDDMYNGGFQAFTWNSTDGLRAIPTGGQSSLATAINNAGQVVGYALVP
jgi:probable HAF family extracellular repeat protein